MISATLLALPMPLAAARQDLQYNRDIRPILADNCFACHGPDSAAREADLRLDQRSDAVDRGAITPGSPQDSEIWLRIVSDDDDRMPPESSHKSLTETEKETLEQWIRSGAEYEPHWAFQTPARPKVPPVSDPQWRRNPIDAFVLEKLESQGLQPAPEADRWTLARRLSLDITGLPPSPELVQEFVDDRAPDAYEKLVDRLLASPAWGEHRGRYWLDVARYADTHGLHFDNYREMWAYRDWVIDAFNRNLPFDQFTLQQLAGDLLPSPTLDQRVATGFHRCNITTNEGGIIDEEYRVLYARDRTETTAQAWLGLTAGCAVCHDHKFDPLSQREFYELSAFFNNTTQAVRDGNIQDTPPTVFVPARADRERWEYLQQELIRIQQDLEQRRETAVSEFETWLRTEDEGFGIPPVRLTDLVFLNGRKTSQPDAFEETEQPEKAEDSWVESGQTLTFPDAGDFESDQPFSFGAWIKFAGQNNGGSLFARMDESAQYRGWDFWSEGGRVGTHLVNSWPGNALKVVTRDALPSDQWVHVMVSYNGSRSAAGVRIYVDGTEVPSVVATDRLNASIRTDVPFQFFQRSQSARVPGLALRDVRIYQTELPSADVLLLARRQQLVEAVDLLRHGDADPESKELVYDWYLEQVDQVYRELDKSQASVNQEMSQIRQRGTLAHVMQERPTPPAAFVLARGEYDQRGEEVAASTPAMLPPMPEGVPRNRLGLAKWLLSEQNPLTARVTVNRFWQSVFGRGLVETSGDFGLTGTPPTHPELLDWLAVDFRENDWDIKRFFRQIFLSQTYRQAALLTDEKRERDPDNVWLSRGPRFRMDAEMIRDYSLEVSGVLVEQLGGPSVKPYQPVGVWEAVAMPESNTRSYQRDSGDNLYRRSIYTFWKRSAPPASMDIFNAPSREVCTVRRERTNTPLQALATLNDPQMIEAARVLATEILRQNPERSDTGTVIRQRLDDLGLVVLARPWREAEYPILMKSHQALQQHYQAHPEDVPPLLTVGDKAVAKDVEPVTLAVWTMLANQLLNLDETLCK